MWTTRRVAAVLTAVVMLALAAPVLHGQAKKINREPVKQIREIAGAATFKAYCTPCHGITARGDGPAATALVMAPADLTTIARRNGGVFPGIDVKATITGDRELAAHGSRDMPMWGPVFRSVDDRSVTELRITNLVSYIETLQER